MTLSSYNQGKEKEKRGSIHCLCEQKTHEYQGQKEMKHNCHENDRATKIYKQQKDMITYFAEGNEGIMLFTH